MYSMDKKHTLIILFLSFIFLGLGVISAQEHDCPVDTFDTLAQVKDICVGTMRNQACYGNIQVSAIPQPNVLDFQFDQPGDMSDVVALKSLVLSPQTVHDESWGIVLMELLTNMETDEPEDVRIVLFGDVTLENATFDRVELDAVVSTSAYVNIRRQPSTNFGVVGTLAPTAVARAIGRLADSSWVRITNPEDNVTGWVSASLLELDGDIEDLIVEESTAPYFGPMQAFYFTSGASTCNNVPLDGLFIQTPEGIGRVSMWVNEVTIDFLSNAGGSTSIIKQPEETEMVIQLLEGAAIVHDNETGEIVIPAGAEVHVPLNPDGTLAGRPEMPVPYDDTGLTQLALAAGYRKVEVAPPTTRDAITTANLITEHNNQEVTKCTPETCPIDEQGPAGASHVTGPIVPTQNTCPGRSCNQGPGQVNNPSPPNRGPCARGGCNPSSVNTGDNDNRGGHGRGHDDDDDGGRGQDRDDDD